MLCGLKNLLNFRPKDSTFRFCSYLDFWAILEDSLVFEDFKKVSSRRILYTFLNPM